MTRSLSQSGLLLMLGCLLALKFLVIPLFEWQQSQLSLIEGKRAQKAKINQLIKSQSSLEKRNVEISQSIRDIKNTFFVDDDKLKLKVQTEIEGMFEAGELRLEGFVWLLDNPGKIRTLRAKVFFNGPVHSLIQLMWDISSRPELFSIIESRQTLAEREGFFSGTQGFVIVEVRALSEDLYQAGARLVE
jgi:hypothetical protein